MPDTEIAMIATDRMLRRRAIGKSATFDSIEDIIPPSSRGYHALHRTRFPGHSLGSPA
jgi:hypothetical protein